MKKNIFLLDGNRICAYEIFDRNKQEALPEKFENLRTAGSQTRENNSLLKISRLYICK